MLDADELGEEFGVAWPAGGRGKGVKVATGDWGAGVGLMLRTLFKLQAVRVRANKTGSTSEHICVPISLTCMILAEDDDKGEGQDAPLQIKIPVAGVRLTTGTIQLLFRAPSRGRIAVIRYG